MNKFWKVTALSIVLGLGIIAASIILLKTQLSPAERAFLEDFIFRHVGHILVTGLILLLLFGWALDQIYRNYISPIQKLTEETELINTANPSHRIASLGGSDVQRLCRQVNACADRYESLAHHLEEKIQRAKSEVEIEKNTLAAMMAELPEGVLICNREGDILFYNQRAKGLLAGDSNHQNHFVDDTLSAQYIGLRRSVYDILDNNLISHALDDILEKLKKNESDAVAYFVLTIADKTLLRVETVPILNQKGHFSGFILILHDITRQLETDQHINILFRSFVQRIRASLAGIRVAAETILDFPDIEPDQLQTFSQIIHDESLNISNVLEANVTAYAEKRSTQWPLIGMPVRKLAEMIIQKAQAQMSIDISWQKIEEDIWIKADIYSFSLAVLFIIQQLNKITGEYAFRGRIKNLGRFVGLDIIWPGNAIKIETMRLWKTHLLIEEGISITLREVLEYHRADFVSFSMKNTRRQACFRLFLPTAEATTAEKSRSLTILPESRPEFYDLNLFRLPGLIPEQIKSSPLAELTYTVFDTETTGLNPEGGDEILSVAAYRIVNCRLLQKEYFDQLVDPRRSIPWSSIRIHGIHPEMLQGQPTIDRVLAMFHRFTAETILVAHNAAFDMQFIKIKEKESGVEFLHPVLDTLLLSAVVFPSQEDHNLEAIAKRLSVKIVGRHTALGDAFTTGHIFLKMIPLLTQKNIHTLQETITACEKTYYARLK